jgi:hypothetical protein
MHAAADSAPIASVRREKAFGTLVPLNRRNEREEKTKEHRSQNEQQIRSYCESSVRVRIHCSEIEIENPYEI